MALETVPATKANWDDLVELFGPRGAYGGCWCMWNRLTNREFEAGQGDANRAALQELVDGGREPGLLAYKDGVVVGWVSVAPREEYGRIMRSPVTKPIDDTPVWAITCFVIHKDHRREGVASALVDAAVEQARRHGAVAVEAYPKDPRKDEVPDIYVWQGLPRMFERAGFREVARRSESRPIMRLDLEDQPA